MEGYIRGNIRNSGSRISFNLATRTQWGSDSRA